MHRKPTPEMVAIEVLGKCDHCGGPLPVNLPVDALECPGCQRMNVLGPAFWAPPLGEARRVATSYGYDVQEVGRHDAVTNFVEWRCHRARFTCPECQAEAVLSEDATALECQACGWRRAVEKTPDWMRQIDGNAVGFVSDAPREEAEHAKATMSAMKCINCGASMTVDGSSRKVDCEYCSTANILSDSVWSVFHPPRVKQRWWLASLIRNDPRRALPLLPEPDAVQRYEDSAAASVGIAAFSIGLAGIATLDPTGAAMQHAIGAGPAVIVVLMISALLFLSLFVGLVQRIRGRLRWKAGRKKRAARIEAFNKGLHTYLPKNEVVARITQVTEEGRKVKVAVDLISRSEPLTILGTTNLMLSHSNFARLGGTGALLRGWYDPASTLSRVSAIPSVLPRVGLAGLEPRDAASLPILQDVTETLPGYRAYLIALAVLGAVIIGLGITGRLV